MRIDKFVLTTLCLLIAVTTFGGSVAGEANNALTVDDVIYMESASGFDVSPDGRWVVWVKSTPDKKESEFKQNIFLSSAEDTVTLEITRSTKNDYSPAFSPDGKKIAFLSRRDKSQPQIYIYDTRGGEPEELTKIGNGVSWFEWRDDDKILFAAREDSTLRENKLKKAKDTTVIVADQEHYAPARLFELELKNKKIKRLTENTGAITEFAISPDGHWVVTNENQSVDFRYDYKTPPRQFLLDLSTGNRNEIMTAPHVAPYGFQWDSAGKGFFCQRSVASDSTDTYVNISHLYYYDLASKRLSPVQLDWENGLGRSYVVVENGFVAELAGGVRDDAVYFEADGSRVKKKHILKTSSGRSIRLAAGQRNGGQLIYLVADASSIPAVMTGVLRHGQLKDERQLAKLNEGLLKKSLARTEIVRWTGALDDEIEGILYYPLDYEEGTRYPVVASIHGGPSGADRDFFSERWSNYPHLLASKGACVFKVNYHGSSSYGLEWVESIKGHYYEYEVPDILSGIEHLIERGLVDPDRLGIMGWSNGSILAIETCLQDERFRVLCAGAGDVNWTSDYGNCAFGAGFDNAYFGGAPWDDPQTYVDKSPLFRMRDMKTPTLIMFGGNDTSVPTEQGWQHFRATQQIGNAPVRFLLFPGEPHGLRKIAHQKRKMEEELAWLDEHLFDDYDKPNEAFDDKSLLAVELKKTDVARDGELFGSSHEDALVPEIVECKGVHVGRFEVTRAQFKAFDSSYDVAPGTGNFPMSGITFDQAKAYCEWLSKQTGRIYRLPTVEEMNELTKSAKSNAEKENNLERWAGFTPTPDELPALEPKIAELEKSRLLLEEVGSFPPVGDPGVYDLGGNAAEWAIRGDGTGEVLGLSAVTSRDSRVTYSPPAAKYVGFRVCEEKSK
jgi:dipeptidyl aminopeptidase/acylaminoacyl peptidase